MRPRNFGDLFFEGFMVCLVMSSIVLYLIPNQQLDPGTINRVAISCLALGLLRGFTGLWA